MNAHARLLLTPAIFMILLGSCGSREESKSSSSQTLLSASSSGLKQSRYPSWLTKSLSTPYDSSAPTSQPQILHKFRSNIKVPSVGFKPAVLVDQTVVIASKDQRIYWLGNDGKQRHSSTSSMNYSPAVLANGYDVVSADHSGLVQFDEHGQKTKSKRAYVSPSIFLNDAPAIIKDDIMLFIDGLGAKWFDTKAKTFELIANTPEQRWCCGSDRSSPIVLSDGTIGVFVEAMDPAYKLDNLYKITADARIENVYTVPKIDFVNLLRTRNHFLGQIAPIALSDNTIVIGSYSGITWVNWETGYDESSRKKASAPGAVLPDGMTVVYPSDSDLFWLEKGGATLNRFKATGNIFVAPAVLSDDTVVVGTDRGLVYWLKDGKDLFKIKLDSVVVTTPVILDDGTVVVVDRQGSVYWLK